MNRAELPIAECEVDWDTMTPVERGRFCGLCKKVVTELTPMTETEVRALMASPPDGLCVRYLCDERDEIILATAGGDTPDGPPKPVLPKNIPAIPHAGVPRRPNPPPPAAPDPPPAPAKKAAPAPAAEP